MTHEPFVSASEVAGFLGLSPRTVTKMAREERLPAHLISGSERKTWRFLISEVGAFLASGNREMMGRTRALAKDAEHPTIQCASRLPCRKRVKQMQPRRKRFQTGCVFLDTKSKTWFFRYYVDGKRRAERIGTKKEFVTKAQAKHAAEPLRANINAEPAPTPLSFAAVWEGYRREKMPARASTRRGYITWAENYILPQWGSTPMPELKPRAIELWLAGLDLEPKSKVNIRMVLSVVYEYAMWAELIPTVRNPMELVTVKLASKPGRKARTMTLEEFHVLRDTLTEPYRTMAIVSVCLGLRWSELVGLQWEDIDWLGGELTLRRAVVKQITGEVKTIHSAKPLSLDARLLDVLKAHKQC
jgi:integrase